MPRTTTALRRALVAVTAAASTVSGLALAVAPAAQADPAICTVSFDPSTIGPGQSSTGHVEKANGSGAMNAFLVIDGHVTSAYVQGATDLTWRYDLWTRQGATTTGGLRVMDASVDPETVTDSTPYLCAGSLDLLPAPKAQTITFPPVPDSPLAVGSFNLTTVSSDSGLQVGVTTNTPDVCTVVPPAPPAAPLGTTAAGAPAFSSINLLTRGWCEIVAHQAGDSDYAPATDVVRGFWVRAPQTLIFPAIADQLLSNGTVALDATVTSGDYIHYTTADDSVCSLPMVTAAPYGTRETAQTRAFTLSLNKVGTCTVTAVQESDGGEWLTSNTETRTFKIYEKSAAPVLTLHAPAGVALSQHTAAFTVASTATSPAVKVTSATPAVCSVAAGSKVNLKKAGTCTIAATQTGATTIKKSFPVWGTPAIPAKAKTTQTVTVLGKGEANLTIKAAPANVCRTTGDQVLLTGPGTCKVTVHQGKRTLRHGSIKVAYVKAAKPSGQLKHGGTAYFAFNSATLTTKAKKALRNHLATLRQASTVVVYGNTYGPGENSAHSRKLAAQRATTVVKYLKHHGVKAKAVKVAAAMENPVSKNPAKNRRADIYYTS
jgi:outer membrane protein OmpA-like peptidoglycan-associated protein